MTWQLAPTPESNLDTRVPSQDQPKSLRLLAGATRKPGRALPEFEGGAHGRYFDSHPVYGGTTQPWVGAQGVRGQDARRGFF